MGVQTEGKIGGGRSRSRRASGDRLFFLKRAEGKALSFCARDRRRMAKTVHGLGVREPGPGSARMRPERTQSHTSNRIFLGIFSGIWL